MIYSDVCALAEALKRNTALTSLSFKQRDKNHTTDYLPAAHLLLEALKTNTTLTSLDLGSYKTAKENQMAII